MWNAELKIENCKFDETSRPTKIFNFQFSILHSQFPHTPLNAANPPSIGTVTPVMKADASDSSHVTVP